VNPFVEHLQSTPEWYHVVYAGQCAARGETSRDVAEAFEGLFDHCGEGFDVSNIDVPADVIAAAKSSISRTSAAGLGRGKQGLAHAALATTTGSSAFNAPPGGPNMNVMEDDSD
jgi:hypothetical protein